MREGSRPSFLYLKYYRYLEHVGVNEDFNQGYRDRKEFERWRAIDPLDLQRKSGGLLGEILVSLGWLDRATLDAALSAQRECRAA